MFDGEDKQYLCHLGKGAEPSSIILGTCLPQ